MIYVQKLLIKFVERKYSCVASAWWILNDPLKSWNCTLFSNYCYNDQMILAQVVSQIFNNILFDEKIVVDFIVSFLAIDEFFFRKTCRISQQNLLRIAKNIILHQKSSSTFNHFSLTLNITNFHETWFDLKSQRIKLNFSYSFCLSAQYIIARHVNKWIFYNTSINNTNLIQSTTSIFHYDWYPRFEWVFNTLNPRKTKI